MLGPLCLPTDFEINEEFQRCYSEVETTSKSIYVSGVAGSGKSTWLTYLRQNSAKKLIVLCPTGIAAVNVQGQTIHSFFRFPHTLIQRQDIRRLWTNGLLEKLDLLVVDEISMVRPDLLDAIDYSLRLNKERFDVPFGGIQVVLIGDLFQLPPVLDKELAEHFLELYDSEYFFSSNIFKEVSFHSFVLTKNYRQKDVQFMSLLNKVRSNSVSKADLQLLNTRVDPEFSEKAKDYLRLTPTNAAANAVNHARLSKLRGREFTYTATITGEYDRRSFPADEVLRLKVHAQVLMVKNDPQKRWVNGSVGEVVELTAEGIKVRIDHGIYAVQPVKWEKITYRHDEAQGIVPEVIGTFEQLPLKLAWAVTIHKSQGLSLDKVIVDFSGGCFSHGQAYTALSRCRSLEGLVLKRPVRFSDIIFDERVHRINDLLTPLSLGVQRT